MPSAHDFTPPLRPHDPRCPECHGRDLYDHECWTCGGEAIDLPRNRECQMCTLDGCGGGDHCPKENPDLPRSWIYGEEDD